MSDSRGSAIVELALVAPVILLIVMATVELSRVLKAAQIANELSQEASNSIYRKCSDFYEPAGEDSADTLARTAQCAQSVWNTEFSPLVTELGPPGTIQITLSIYRRLSSGTVKQFAIVNDSPAPRNTRFSISGGTIVAKLNPQLTVTLDSAFVTGHERIAIAEVFIQVNPILRMIPIINSSVSGGDYYAASIL